jgi:hypothetical protein
MGVISFGDDKPVWGSSASLMRGLIGNAIVLHGQKDYLQHLNYKMEWMYNHLDMTELHVEELKEFASAIPSYRASYLAIPGLQQVTLTGAAQLLDELAAMMKGYIDERVTKGELRAERDFWTLRSAAEADRRLRAPVPEIADPVAFVAELAERVHSVLRELYRSRAEKGDNELANTLTLLGAAIGKSPDSLDYPEAVFRLIEDGMQPDNENVSNAVLRQLIPAMVEASVEAGTWEMLQRQLGDETRRWAQEHYDFEVAPPEATDLLPHEWQRLKDLINAARADDWNRFRELSEEPFANEEAMKEQFEMSVSFLKGLESCRVTYASAAKARGARLVHAEIGDPAREERVGAILNCFGTANNKLIGVWVFCPETDWS